MSGRKLNLLDPYDNATAGVAIIRQLIRTSKDLDYAIAGYYQGQYSVNKHGMYADTKAYVAAIKAHQKNFQLNPPAPRIRVAQAAAADNDTGPDRMLIRARFRAAIRIVGCRKTCRTVLLVPWWIIATGSIPGWQGAECPPCTWQRTSGSTAKSH